MVAALFMYASRSAFLGEVVKSDWGRLRDRARVLACVLAVTSLLAPSSLRAVEGSLLSKQLVEGEKIYEEACGGCHGPMLEGAGAGSLAGEDFKDRWVQPGRRGTDLLDVVLRQMPINSPGSLSKEEAVRVVTYILKRNGLNDKMGSLDVDRLRQPIHRLLSRGDTIEAMQDSPGTASGALRVVKPSGVDYPNDEDLIEAVGENWLLYNRDLKSQRYSPLSQINVASAPSLQAHCAIQLGEVGSFQSGPVVAMGRMYVTTPRGTYALDAGNCERLWEHTYIPGGNEPWLANRGVALYRGRLFRGTTDGHLLSLDAATGDLLWDIHLVDSGEGYFLSGAPIAFDGKVFIGTAGADWGANGRLFALDVETGRIEWSFEVIPRGDQPGAETWGGGSEHGGGSMWTTLTLESTERVLYVSVGNPSPNYNGTVRPGENLFTNSVIVVNIDSGELVRYSQLVSHDLHDWNLAAAPTLYDQGRMRMLAIAGKDGWLHLLDRNTFERIARQEVSSHLDADKAPTLKGVYTCPGPVGGVEWNGVAYAADSGVLLVNSVDWCATYYASEAIYVRGAPYTGGRTRMDPVSKARGWLRAFDAKTGEPRWTYASPTPMVAAVTPTRGGVALTGDLNGNFLVFETRSGRLLYRFRSGGAIAGGVVTYEIDGRQFVAVASGNKSRTVWSTQGAATIMVFALPEALELELAN